MNATSPIRTGDMSCTHISSFVDNLCHIRACMHYTLKGGRARN